MQRAERSASRHLKATFRRVESNFLPQTDAHTQVLPPNLKQLLTMGAGQIKLTKTSRGRDREKGNEKEKKRRGKRKGKEREGGGERDCRQSFQRQSVS